MLEELAYAVKELDEHRALQLVKSAVESGVPPLDIIDKGLVVGIRQVGDLFEQEEYFLPELMMAGDLAKGIMKYMEPYLPSKDAVSKKVAIASVEGDMHDLGKNLVALMLQTNGYDVLDLGINVPTPEIVSKATAFGASVIALSALMVTTMPSQKTVVKQLTDAGLRDQFKVIIGGAPTTQEWADEIGADAWAQDAAQAVKALDKLLA